MNIEESLNIFFNKKDINSYQLLKLVVEALDDYESTKESASIISEKEEKEGGRFSMTIPLPSFSPTEAWGDPESQDRDHVMKVFSVVRGGRDMKQKVQNINKFLDPAVARGKRSPGVIINMMMVIEALQATLNDFNESAAGFVFEAFMAALTGGHQVKTRVGGTLPIEDFVAFSDYGGDSGVPVSLKLLKAGGNTKGSYTNIVDYLLVGDTPIIKYIVAYKAKEGENVGELQFWEFEVTRGNFVDFIEGVGQGAHLLHGVDRLELKQLAANFNQDPSNKHNHVALAALLAQTAGYTKTGDLHRFLETGGLTPEEDESVMSPEEKKAKEEKERKEGEKEARKAQKGREAAIATSKEQEQTGNAEIRNESFHGREKRLLQEGLLLEAEGATQWLASWDQLDALKSVINLTSYGLIDLSQSRIDQVAKIYVEKLKGGVMALLEKTKSLAENIGSYFREERRSKANEAAEIAKNDAREIRKVMAKDPRYTK